MRYMGLDIGDRWIGVALSDPSGRLASPLTILRRSDDTAADLEAINGIITENQVGIIVAGLPRMLDGSIGIQAEKVNTFIQQLRDAVQVPVKVRDEWLTTVAAKHIMPVSYTHLRAHET